MNEIPNSVVGKLDKTIYLRKNSKVVASALSNLGVRHDLLCTFLERYKGPFWSDCLGYEFLDIFDGNETIESSTLICRQSFGFPEKLLVLSQFSAGQVLALDTLADKVYEVDFEGGDEMLKQNTLNPRWESFCDFLIEYFS